MSRNNPKTDENNVFFNRIVAWLQKDILFIIIAALCLAACLYTINSVGEYKDQINDAWMQQWNESCPQQQRLTPQLINISYNIRGDYNDVKNKNQDS